MFERILSLFRKESRTGKVIFKTNADVQWSQRNYKAFADEGFTKNVICFQAINKTASAVAAIPWILKDKSEKVIDIHPLIDLINRPNPLQSKIEFLESVVGYYRIAGNSYLERVMVSGAPKEMYALRPDRMTVLKAETGLPRGYMYKAGMTAVTWDSDIATGESDIRHLKTFNPLDDWYGLSPIEPGAYGVDQHTEAMKFIQGLLQNGAAPSGVLEMSVDEELTPDQYNRLKVEIDQKYSGGANAGRPLLLEGGMKWTQMGFSPEAMGTIKSKDSAARDISLALSVPPLLLNIQGDATYSNYKEARLAFYEETVIPLGQAIIDEFNVWMKKDLGELKFHLDLQSIPAIIDKRVDLWGMVDKSGELTINEKREMKGFEPVTGGNVVLIGSTQVPLTFEDDNTDHNSDHEDEGEKAFGKK